MTTAFFIVVRPFLSASIALSQLGERLVRGRRAYLVYRRRYGYHV